MRQPARAIQVCGTGSGVGKSIIVTALCRIFLQDGFKVCPFKAQNMALNSFVTKEQGEIGRAQATQAQACRLEPTVDMNPILLKPTSERRAQIIVRGRPIRNMSVYEYVRYKKRAKNIVFESFRRLAKEYELIVIEGAGSPAEVNLKSHDIVNMKMAEYANAPVVLVGDIDKGGVFAWIVGTLELLTKAERKRIKGIIINKFRGDKRLLKPGIDFLEQKTKVKVLGVVPYFSVAAGNDINLPEEDSVSLEIRNQKPNTKGHKIEIVVVKLPHISNFTDFDALSAEADVELRYVSKPEELNKPDTIIIPGTKNTIADLLWLKQSGLANQILSAVRCPLSAILIGICGGYQMLGKKIYDRHSLESKCSQIQGLNILPIETSLKRNKILTQVKAKDLSSGLELSGYEIHHGHTKITGEAQPLFEIFQRNGAKTSYFDGASSDNGRIIGTYIHGLFDTGAFRRDFLNKVRLKKGWPLLSQAAAYNPDGEIDKLAKLVRENLDMKYLYKILNKHA